MRTSKVYFYSHAEGGMIIHASRYLRFALFFFLKVKYPVVALSVFLFFLLFSCFLASYFLGSGEEGEWTYREEKYIYMPPLLAKLGFYPCV